MRLRVGIIVWILARAPVLIRVQMVLVEVVQIVLRRVVPVLQVVHVLLVQMIVHHLVKRHVKIHAKTHVLHHVKVLRLGNRQQEKLMGMNMLIWV